MRVSLRTARKRAREGGWIQHVKTDLDWIAVRDGYVWSQGKADHVMTFFDKFLVFSKGEWARQPFRPLRWQAEEVLMPVFAWVHGDTGYRRVSTLFVWIGRRNGKSTLIAGISLYMILADGEFSAEGYVIASTVKQAKALYGTARDMARLSPNLRKRLKFNDAVNLIRYPDAMSSLQVLAPVAESALGVDAHLLVVDELAAQARRDLWDAMRHSTGSRRQPLTVAISTAGWNRETLAGEIYDYACGVRDGRIEDTSFWPVIYESPIGCDAGDESAWRAANPSLGTSPKLDEFRRAYKEAVVSPRKMAAFRMFRLNQWVSAAEAYIEMSNWIKCSSRAPNMTYVEWREALLEQMAEEGCDCWLGLDCGGSRDMTALIALFRKAEDQYAVAAWVWCPEESTRPNERPEIEGFITDGVVETMPGNWTDFGTIEELIVDLHAKLAVRALCYDRTFAGPMIQRLMSDVECIPVAQTAGSLNNATRELDRLILAQGIDHGSSGVLDWMAANLQVTQNRGDQLRPSKPKTAKKIDGMSALITALAVAMTVPSEPVYNTVESFYFTGDRKAEPKSSNSGDDA